MNSIANELRALAVTEIYDRNGSVLQADAPEIERRTQELADKMDGARTADLALGPALLRTLRAEIDAENKMALECRRICVDRDAQIHSYAVHCMRNAIKIAESSSNPGPDSARAAVNEMTRIAQDVKNCIACKHFEFDSGWCGTEETPGDPASMNCSKGHWKQSGWGGALGMYEGNDKLLDRTSVAASCPDYCVSELAKAKGWTP